MVTIDTTPLKPGHHRVTLSPAPQELNLPPDAFEDIVVDVRLELQQERAYVDLEASGVARLVCDRTLAEFQLPVSGEHAVLFLPESQASVEHVGDRDDVRPLPEAGEPLDITDAVRDTLMLALPARTVAPGMEDRDIPTVFGGDSEEPTDPRWEALRRLRDDASESDQ